MADHGSIGTYRQTQFYAIPLPTWARDHRALTAIPITGTISGTVKEAGVAKPWAWVALYYRKSGVLIGRQRASATGTFLFAGLEAGVDEYYVVALDDGFNALVFDIVEAA